MEIEVYSVEKALDRGFASGIAACVGRISPNTDGGRGFMPIQTLYWGEVPADTASKSAALDGRLLCVWPAPLSPDSCFEKAGFRDFGYPDEKWHRDWSAMVERAVSFLRHYGTPTMRTPLEVEEVVEPSFLKRLLFRRPYTRPLHLSEVQQLLLATEDDQFRAAVLDFLPEKKIALATSAGHTAMWLSTAEGHPFDTQTFFKAVADGRTVVEAQLAWEYIACTP